MMNRLPLRIAVSLLTFTLGVMASKLPLYVEDQPIQHGPQRPEAVVLTPPKQLAPQTTSDDAKGWQRISALPATVGERPNASIQFIDEQEGWLAIDDKLWHTTNGGKAWRLVFAEGVHKYGFTDFIQRFEFIDLKTGWLIAADKMYKTVDGGETWHVFKQPFPAWTDGLLCDFKFLKDGRRGWVAGGMYRPISAGDREQQNIPHTRYTSIDDKQGLCGAIFYTEDGGQSWRRQLLTEDWGYIGDLYALDEQHVWATGMAGTFYLKDGQWASTETSVRDADGELIPQSLSVVIGAPTYQPRAVYFVNSQVGWLFNSNGFVGRSIDGGRTWQDILRQEDAGGTTDDPDTPSFIKFHFDEPLALHGLALASDGQLYETNDGGRTWTRLAFTMKVMDFYFSDTRSGWAVAREGIFRFTL